MRAAAYARYSADMLKIAEYREEALQAPAEGRRGTAAPSEGKGAPRCARNAARGQIESPAKMAEQQFVY